MALAQQHLVGGEGVAGRGRVVAALFGPILARHHLDLARPTGAAAAREGHGQAAGEHCIEQQAFGGFEALARGREFNDMAIVHTDLRAQGWAGEA
ncbi:hypothetical protein D3C79_772370 [compost metagenome]